MYIYRYVHMLYVGVILGYGTHSLSQVRDCVQLNVTPLDGASLCVLMHERGINMRYLGKVAMYAALREDLDHLTVSGGYN